ncbi:hypothetical protein BC834DRAFT_975501 [Gloeopeniophorella convolvens]|nr:hypothetical protein BC834DRAFT_975501 [Gloeopeniophorella convolvens]
MRLLSLLIVCLAVVVNASPIQGNDVLGHIARTPQSQKGADWRRTAEDIKRDPQSQKGADWRRTAEDIKRDPQSQKGADWRRTAEDIKRDDLLD